MPLPAEQKQDAGERRPSSAGVKLATIQRHIAEGRRARDPMFRIWQAIYDQYKSDPTSHYDVDSEYYLQANLVYAWYESIWPSLLFRNPVFHANPLTEESESSSKTVSSVVTGELKALRFKRELRRCGFDFLMYGVGAITQGYYGGGLLTQDRKSRDRAKNSDVPHGFEEGRLYTRAIRPHRLLIDPSASSQEDAMWMGIEYDRDVEAVKKDPQYQHTSDLEANVWAMPRGMTEQQYQEKWGELPQKTKVRLVQYYDIVDRKVYVVTEGHEHFLGEYDFTLPVNRFPIYVARASDDEDDFWCQPPIAAWLNLVHEHNIAISRRLNHTSRHYRRYAYDSDSVDETAVDVLSQPVHAAIPVRANGGDVRQKIAPIQDAAVSPDSYAFTRESLQLWQMISGMNELDLGAMRPGERPAAETERMSSASNARRSALGERLQSMLEDLAADTLAIMQRYYSEERAVEITGEYGQTEWVRYTGTELTGKYRFECRIAEMAIKTPESSKREAAETLQMFAPFSQFGGSPAPAVDLVPMIQRFAREMGVQELRLFPQANPPLDPAMEWYMIVQKGLDLQPNELDDHQFHVFTHEAQLVHPETLKSPHCVARLRNHIERHRAMILAVQMGQPTQAGPPEPGGGGEPGPGPGNTNNPAGGAGVFSRGSGSTPQGAGSTGENLMALLRGGMAGEG